MASYLELEYKQPRVANRQPVPVRRPIRMSFKDVEQLRNNHAEVASGLSTLQREIALLGASPETMALLEHVQSAAGQIQAHSRDLWRLVPVPHRPSASSARVAKILFDTAELLEEILTYLPLDQILIAMRVQRSWYNTIKGSVKILRMLGLAPAANDIFDSPFSSRYVNRNAETPNDRFIRGLSLPRFMSFAETHIWRGWDQADMDYQSASQLAEQLLDLNLLDLNILCRPSIGRAPGARIASIRICTLRVQRLWFSIQCHCHRAGRDNVYHRPLSRADDTQHLTVGELVACTHDVLRTYGHVHVECVSALVRFHVQVELSDTDPITLHRREQLHVFRNKLTGYGVGQKFWYATKLFFIRSHDEWGDSLKGKYDSPRYIDEDDDEDDEDAADGESGRVFVHEEDDGDFEGVLEGFPGGDQKSQDENEDFQGEYEEVIDGNEEFRDEAEGQAR